MQEFRTFKEFVKAKDHQIDTAQVGGQYERIDIAISLAVEWDIKENQGRLFSNVTGVENLSGGNYGLFNSALGKPDPKLVTPSPINTPQSFPGKVSLTQGYPIQINVQQILKDSPNDLQAIKRIGGVAVHEASHASDYSGQISQGKKPSLSETGPEQNRLRFEKWFDQNSGQILMKYPTLSRPSRQFGAR